MYYDNFFVFPICGVPPTSVSSKKNKKSCANVAIPAGEGGRKQFIYYNKSVLYKTQFAVYTFLRMIYIMSPRTRDAIYFYRARISERFYYYGRFIRIRENSRSFSINISLFSRFVFTTITITSKLYCNYTLLFCHTQTPHMYTCAMRVCVVRAFLAPPRYFSLSLSLMSSAFGILCPIKARDCQIYA